MIRSSSLRLAPAWALLLALVACFDSAAAPSCVDRRSVDEVLARKDAKFELALLYGAPAGDQGLSAARQLQREALRAFELREPRDASKWSGDRPRVAFAFDGNASRFDAPSDEYVSLMSRGLSAIEQTQVRNAQARLVVSFDLPAKNFVTHFAAANRFISTLAKRTGAIIDDIGTREYFSVPAWVEARESEPDDLMSASRHITIHAFRSGEYLRAVTVGMTKLGLPDLSVSELAASENRAVGTLINAVAQRLFEGPTAVRRGALAIRLSELRPTAARKSFLADVLSGGSGVAEICLREVAPETGDDDNRQLEITFGPSRSNDSHATRHANLAATFGAAPGKVLGARADDKDLLDASARAREKIPELRKLVAAGLHAGERMMVKIGFPAGDGSKEYMWVEVSRWTDSGTVHGLLMNEPRDVRSLKAGQRVTVQETDVYDYVRVHPDGRTEGNETGKILEQRSNRR